MKGLSLCNRVGGILSASMRQPLRAFYCGLLGVCGWLVDSFRFACSDQRHEFVGLRNWQLAVSAIRHGAQQNPYEVAVLFHRVRKMNPRAVLEIGLAAGGTFEAWPKLANPEALIVGLDLKRPKAWPGFRLACEVGQRMEFVEGDSHSPETLKRIRDMFPEGVDLIFIDGDHSYAGSRMDFEFYSPLVQPGGIVAFHDICPDWEELYGIEGKGGAGQVWRFWGELRRSGRRIEQVITQLGQSGSGIGIVHL